MMSWQAVSRTDQNQISAGGLRITEVSGVPLRAASQARLDKCAEVLRTASGHLQRAWRWLENKRTLQMSSRRLRVAETISLGEKRSVSIVQVDGAQYLIGSSVNSVQLLAVLDDRKSGKSGSETSQVLTEEVAS